MTLRSFRLVCLSRRTAFLSGLLAVVSLSVACAGSSGQKTANAGPQPASPAKEYRRRVVLDSGEIQVAVTSAAASVKVISPEGTFLQAFPNREPFVRWGATIAQSLAPNATGTGADVTVIGTERRTDSLPAPIDPDAPTTFWLERTTESAAPSYHLAGTNGAWGFVLALKPTEVAALAAALRGEEASGVQSYSAPRRARTPEQAIPSVEGAWLALQVDQPAANPAEPIALHYPAEMRDGAVAGIVRLSFIIDSTGLVRPSSIGLIGHPPALQARVAKEQLLTLRLRPAVRLGHPVSQLSIHDFRLVP